MQVDIHYRMVYVPFFAQVTLTYIVKVESVEYWYLLNGKS